MNALIKKFSWKFLLSILALLLFMVPGYSSTPRSITLLFTHDLHSHFTSLETGGYARLATLLKQKRALLGSNKVLTVDAGDFSMGTLFHTLFTTDASELQLMSQMGYDVVTFGNHDFDFHNDGLAEALQTTLRNTHREGSPRPPALVASNVLFPTSNLQPAEQSLQQAFRTYPVREYTIVEKNGLRIGIFGLLGKDAANDAPFSKPLQFEANITAARRVVEKIRKQVDLVVCLSHSGTNADPSRSEDEILARKVPGIDVIISGHTHTVLPKSLFVGNTLIVSAGSYGRYLGELSLEVTDQGNISRSSYRLEEVVLEIPEETSIAARIKNDKKKVEKNYLSRFNLRFDQVLAETNSTLDQTRLGNLITDSYRYAIQKVEGTQYEPIMLAVEPIGHIRDILRKGPLTTADIFRVLSLGLGYDKTAGYPLLAFYVTGKEIRDILEVEPSIAPLKNDAQLRISGMRFSYNPHRLPFDRVTSASFVLPNGTLEPVDPDQLYRVAMNSYTAHMIEFVGQLSHGLLKLVPKDKSGKPITEFPKLRVNASPELKEWDALAMYLRSFPDTDQNGVPNLPPQYETTEERITTSPSWNPIHLIAGGAGLTLKVLLSVSAIAGLLILSIFLFARRKKQSGRGKRTRRSKT